MSLSPREEHLLPSGFYQLLQTILKPVIARSKDDAPDQSDLHYVREVLKKTKVGVLFIGDHYLFIELENLK